MRFPSVTLEYCALLAALGLIVQHWASAVGLSTLEILARVNLVMQ